MRVLTPHSLDESLQMLASTDGPVRPVAGGTDLLVGWHHQVKDDWTLMDLSRLRNALGRLSLTDQELELGGLTTYWEVMQSPAVAAAFPLLAIAARQVGAVQIQTRGTWAGNIANGSPAADGVPVLLAYGAVVVLTSSAGQRRVPLDQYFTGYKQSVRRPDELITAICMPRRTRHFEWFEKVGAPRAQAITKVGAAVVHDDAGWRIAANSVAPFVCRCRRLEAELGRGARFADPPALRATLDRDVAPISDIRSTAEYRAVVLSRILYHALQTYCQW